MRTILLAIALWLLPGEAFAQERFVAGQYYALPRDSTAHNRFAAVEFDFQADGALLWRSGGEVQQIMAWHNVEQVFEIEESVGCTTSPRGVYRVARWLDGFAFEVMQDGCTNRVAALNAIYLVPKDRIGPLTANPSRSPGRGVPASPVNSPAPRND